MNRYYTSHFVCPFRNEKVWVTRDRDIPGNWPFPKHGTAGYTYGTRAPARDQTRAMNSGALHGSIK